MLVSTHTQQTNDDALRVILRLREGERRQDLQLVILTRAVSQFLSRGLCTRRGRGTQGEDSNRFRRSIRELCWACYRQTASGGRNAGVAWVGEGFLVWGGVEVRWGQLASPLHGPNGIPTLLYSTRRSGTCCSPERWPTARRWGPSSRRPAAAHWQNSSQQR